MPSRQISARPERVALVDCAGADDAGSRAAEGDGARRDIPFGRPMLGDDEKRAVAEVLDGHILTHGPRVRSFEASFAAFTGAPHAIATNSCTAALHLAYMFLEIGPGDEVIVPAQTHVATAHAVELCGASAVFADVDPATGNIDLEHAAALITPRTRALSVVHFLGLPVDMTRAVDLARTHGLFLVEDCALALGATWGGRHVGLLGDVGVFSFYPVKHITTGEGGMLITTRDDLAADAARRRAFGIDRNVVQERPVPGLYDVLQLGNNYRLSEIGAALGIEQMRRLPGFLDARRSNHAAVAAELADVDGVRLLENAPADATHACYCQFIELCGDLADARPAIIERLRAAGVGTSIYYPSPVPLMSYFRARNGLGVDDFPMAARLSRASLALPVGPHLDRDDPKKIATAVTEAIAAVSR